MGLTSQKNFLFKKFAIFILLLADTDQGTRVKRLELGSDVIAVQSDNPDKQAHPTEYLTGPAMNAVAQNIIGQVVWSGHRWA